MFEPELLDAVVKAVIAGILASLACGLGVVPLWIKRMDPAKHRGLGYATAGGLMFSASVYNLILPALNMTSRQGSPAEGQWPLVQVLMIVAGILLGATFLWQTDRLMPHDDDKAKPISPRLKAWGGRLGLLVFLAMMVHSIPEGVAVGVGYASDAHGISLDGNLGPTLALAIAIHNAPEGLAVAIPLRSAGASLWRCFWAAVLTSLPQPIAAIPAVLLAWFFQPIMPLLMGFAAGAMIFLVLVELIPEALHTESPSRITWAFTFGFCGMLLIQVVL